MDKLAEYREIVKKLIFQYATHKPYHGKIEVEAIIDNERNLYEVVHVGWDGVRRVHGSVVHIDISGEKIWIQYDDTEEGIVTDLIDEGVSKNDIVLGFRHPKVRQYTGFAVA